MTEHHDVLIVGAGIAGVSAAWHLQDRCPDKSYVILEGRDRIGGTWDLFKYPGIRSDSDMYTLGFRFKPWSSGRAIGDGASILGYVKETVAEAGIDKHIRTGHRVTAADWSDAENQWTVTVARGAETITMTSTFLYIASGYYNYENGYTPVFAGSEDFPGPIVHPQHWPTDLDYADKKVVVIGSGATAVTLIPALVNSGAGHVTMLQRSPTFIGMLGATDPVAAWIIKVLPEKAAYVVNRWRAILFTTGQYMMSRRFPKLMRGILIKMATRMLPDGYDVDKHFNPRYDPWDERLCLAPNGDLFKTISAGQAEVVTDTIEKFDATGIALNSGEHIDADVIITATGLNLQLFGGAEVRRNGEVIDLATTMSYKGMMLSGLPNMTYMIGYTNASWTLKADLVSEFFCRVLNFMDESGYDTYVVEHPGDTVEQVPLLEFTPGYVLRSQDKLPRAGARAPWNLKQNYLFDIRTIRQGPVAEKSLHFSRHRVPAGA